MNAIKQYIDEKTNKKMYKIDGAYIGKNLITKKEKRIKKKGFKTKKEAELYIAQARLEFQNSNGILPENITFKRLWDLWYETKRYKVSKKTLYVIENQRKKYIFPFCENLQVKKIHTTMIQEYFNTTLAPLLSENAMKLTRTYLKSVLEYAVDLDLLLKNPARKVKIPNKEKKETIFLEKEQLKKFLEVSEATGKKIYIVFTRILAYTGARKGEIASLLWSDIDFKKKTININKTITQNEKGSFEYGSTTKTKASNRVISIDEETLKLLIELKKEQKVLTTRIFGLKYYRGVSYHIKKCGKAIGAESLKVHDLRRTHTTMLLEAGVDVIVVKERLGHSNIQTTLAIYAKVTKKQRKDVINTFLEHIA